MNDNFPDPATPEEALALSRRYPYYIYPLIKTLPEAGEEQRTLFSRRISAAVDDSMALGKIFGIDAADLQRFYPPLTPDSLTTDETINSFLEKFSDESAPSRVVEEVPVAPPVGDYAASLEMEEPLEEVHDATSDMLDTFLSANPAPQPRRRRPADLPLRTEPRHAVADAGEDREAASAASDSSALTESFAGIMIKNGNYEKALEIITQLSLNNPKKNIYFADQIRFLKKLILNKSKS